MIKYFLLFFFISFPCLAQDNIILYGLDGVGRDAVNHLGPSNLPNLYNLGMMVEAENTANTATLPGWSNVFWGLSTDQSLIITNNNWANPLPFETSLPGILKSNGYKIGWFASKYYWGKSCNITPLCTIAQNADVFINEPPKGDKGEEYLEHLLPHVLEFIENNKDNKFFIGFMCDPDYFGHLYGSGSPEYYNEIKKCDNALGQILSKLDNLGIRSKTKILAVSDHGFDPNAKSHANAPDSILITDLFIKRRGTLRDIPITVLTHLGLPQPAQMRGVNLLELESLWRN